MLFYCIVELHTNFQIEEKKRLAELEKHKAQELEKKIAQRIEEERRKMQLEYENELKANNNVKEQVSILSKI